MKLKIGDKILLAPGREHGGGDMNRLCGSVATIKQIRGWKIYVVENDYYWDSRVLKRVPAARLKPYKPRPGERWLTCDKHLGLVFKWAGPIKQCPLCSCARVNGWESQDRSSLLEQISILKSELGPR